MAEATYFQRHGHALQPSRGIGVYVSRSRSNRVRVQILQFIKYHLPLCCRVGLSASLAPLGKGGMIW